MHICIQVLFFGAFLIRATIAVDCSIRPKHTVVTKCCPTNAPSIEILDKCAAQNPPDQPQKQFCYGECIFNETGLTVNHKIQMNKIQETVSKIYKSMPDVIAKVTPVMIYCIDYAKKAAVDIKARAAAGDCNPEFGIILSCFLMGTFEFCPTTAWTNTDECNKAREFQVACA